ncbi:MAG: bifunctional riboflavin kinase/FAD synthetase [Deltaproteobacteria bacterium]|nr:bifunctional riboflavin kinase/FAD synthetase [Deltaproteobacteria bacterium]
MTVITDLGELTKPLINPVLTIGNFDGVHKGHLALFDRVKILARGINGQSVVMTFEPHPLKVVRHRNEPKLITPLEDKIRLILAAGIDVIFCLPFTLEFAAISAHDFVQELLLKKIGIKEIVVGYDYSFGSGRKGNIELLKKMGEELGFRVHVVEPVYLNDTLISSTSIRNLIREGNLAGAKRLLGRDHQITGIVKTGMGRGGSLLNFPTANLAPYKEIIPGGGVYAVRVILKGREYNGVCNIGTNPTFNGESLSIETHILDFSDDIVGEKLAIRFVDRLRDEKKYSSKDELIGQIEKDVINARKILELNGK